MSKIKSLTRVALLRRPWLTYGQVRDEISPHVTKVANGTVGVYGAEIRPEIGCTLTTQSGREELHVDLERYEAAGVKYGIMTADREKLLNASTPNRKVVVISPKVAMKTLLDDLEPASPAVIDAAKTIVEQITGDLDVKLSKMRKGDLVGLPYKARTIEERLALHEATHAALAGKDASIREDLTAKVEAAELRCTSAREAVKELEADLAAARRELDEAQEALAFLDSLTEAPFSVIRAVLG